ncbi:hypothetical protein ABKN59_010608 [Abortiporus biennis]
MLTYYELDLGLNHVTRKWSEPTDSRANLLVQVPGGQSSSSDHYDGPSGVLVCCENHIIYRHMDVPQHRIPIPRRKEPSDDPQRGVLITAAIMHKMKGAFFFILQSEEGDLFKVTIDHDEQDVKAIKIRYFDTVPVASSLCILKSGFLFVASEFGNHHLYQFQKLGDDDDETEVSSTDYPEFGMTDPSATLAHVYFNPHPLENLSLVDELESLDPIIDSEVISSLPDSQSPQIFTACGRGARSSFRKLRHGIDVEEVVSHNLQGIPNAVWTIKLKEDDEFDSYIILSFINGFLSSAPTLAVQQIGADSLLQIHPRGIRHILANKRVNEWVAPAGKTIATATTNKRQVVVALSSAELVYFELDLEGQLNEYQDRKAMGSTVLALSIADVPQGRQRTPFLAVGCEDQTVRIISLDPESTLETVSLQALTAPPSSICIAAILDTGINKTQPTTFVNIGLQNGVLLRTVLDPVTGQLTDTRTRFLGAQPIRLVRTTIGQNPGILALSTCSWLNYTYQDSVYLTPLLFDNLDYAWSFSAALRPEGLIGISGSVFRILRIPKLGTKFKQDSLPLQYTPREFVSHPTNGPHQETKTGGHFACLDEYSGITSRCWNRFIEDGRDLELLHKTETDDIPLAVMAFQGRLAVGVGKALRLYDIGKKKLLKKVENKSFTSAIVTLNTQGSRIIVGDMQDSIFYVVYKPSENRLLVFADDPQPRWITATTMVDYNTVVCGDRFGNIFANRLDAKISDEVDNDPTGDIVTSIHKVSLVIGAREVLLYTGLHGTIGILVPFVSKEDVDLISTLEQHMRTEQISLIGRDHLAWRGYYVPVKAVVDGDLCENFARLTANKQRAIAGELDRTVGEVLRKLEQLRVNGSGF